MSAAIHQPQLFTATVPLGGALLLAQGVMSTIWLTQLPRRRGVTARNPAWLIGGQMVAAVFVWVVLVWVFWLGRTSFGLP